MVLKIKVINGGLQQSDFGIGRFEVSEFLGIHCLPFGWVFEVVVNLGSIFLGLNVGVETFIVEAATHLFVNRGNLGVFGAVS